MSDLLTTVLPVPVVHIEHLTINLVPTDVYQCARIVIVSMN